MENSMINQTFWIKDAKHRLWGSFTVIIENTTRMGTDVMHGYLKPTPAFEEISPIFREHEYQMSKMDGSPDATWQQISVLHPYLVSAETGQIMDIRGIIFVSEKLLVTCEVPQ